jgi:hypothetical protein
MARYPERDNEQCDDEEAQRRFLIAVKAGLDTKPKSPQEYHAEGRSCAIEETAKA